MRKGLITLMTVAIALISVKAMAMAPTIGDIPNPVIGDVTAATNPTPFTYVDAMDIESFATDPEGTLPANLIWSYEIVGTPKYSINGDPVIDSTVDLPTSPSLAKRINKTVGSGETNTDGKANTITIRNINFRPFTGTGATPPTTAGFVTGDTQAVTFYVSDGNAYSSKTVLFYTRIGVASYLSSRDPWKVEKSVAFSGFPNTGTGRWSVIDGPFGGVTTATWNAGTDNGKGLCFNVAAAGDNFMSMRSPNPYFTLTANTVYWIRARMNCSQATGGATPFWDFIVENTALNLYAMDTYFQDNEGSANAVVSSTAGTWIDMYWAPLAMRTTQWNDAGTGIFKAAYAAQKDPALRFRVLDVTSNPGVKAAQQSGRICLMEVVIKSVPYSRVSTKTANVVNITSLAAANAGGTGNVLATALVGSTIAFNGGVLTATPTAGATAEIVEVTPQADTNAVPTGRIYRVSQYPIAWTSNKLYELTVNLAAADATGQTHPYDVIWLSMESPTWEITTESYVTSNQSIGSPRTGTAQPYTLFYNSGKLTNSGTAEFRFLRWRLRFGNNTSLLFPSGSDLTNTGGVSVSGINVREIKVN